MSENLLVGSHRYSNSDWDAGYDEIEWERDDEEADPQEVFQDEH